MNIKAIEQLALQGESETVEFKTSTTQLKGAFETTCAFVNGRGGTVLIGVNDEGKVIGQEISDRTQQEIAREIGKIEPSAPMETTYISLTNKRSVILIKVSQGLYAPYIYDGRAYQRHQSTTVRMPQQRYEHLLMKRTPINYSWEKAPAGDYSVIDLDHEEIHKTVADGVCENRIPSVAQGENTTIILERLGLISKDLLNQAAMILYAKPQSLRLIQCCIKMARFIGKDKLGDYIDNKRFEGNAFAILAEAEAFLRRHLSIASFFKPNQFKRIDQPTLPVLAVREAFNAICHRDYADRSTDISLAIFDDRIEIWNSGSLPASLKISDLRKAHHSVPRNQLIAKSFYVRGFIKAWGTGTNKMIKFCRELGVPLPLFKEQFNGILVTFRFKEPLRALESAKQPIQSLSKRQLEILKVLSSQAWVDYPSIHSSLANPPAKRTLQLDLYKLKQGGWLHIKGHARSAEWRLTDKGREQKTFLDDLTQF